MVRQFPSIPTDHDDSEDEDSNPAIRLFGRRLIAEQTVPELLTELLLVASSEKRVGDVVIDAREPLPSPSLIAAWPRHAFLEYAPKARLNLKLFAFLGASKLETRHVTHRFHYEDLVNRLGQTDHLVVSCDVDHREVLRTMQNLFLGFQSVGGSRTWCAQSFLPIAPEMIAAESIWKETAAAKAAVNTWNTAIKHFSHTQRVFLARGGELLYLQMCNALSQTQSAVDDWCRIAAVLHSSVERDLQQIHKKLTESVATVLSACPETVGRLASLIDSGIDATTAAATDSTPHDRKRFSKCGWCPQETWPEGLLYCLEFINLCGASIDPIERIEMLEIASALQVLRTLCAQSARHCAWARARQEVAPLGYAWVLSDPEGANAVLKQLSRRSVGAVQRLIHDAIREDENQQPIPPQRQPVGDTRRGAVDPYKEADTRYGHKLFLSLAKRIGLIAPKRGAGARFLLTDRVLRCMVLSVIPAGGRVTYETFIDLLYRHYGLAMTARQIGLACTWGGSPALTTLGEGSESWLMTMLDAAGMLVRLSDACSLVVNPFGYEETRV